MKVGSSGILVEKIAVNIKEVIFTQPCYAFWYRSRRLLED